MVTSTMSRVLNYEHKPQWREGDLRIKKSWVAKVEEMQVILHIVVLNLYLLEYLLHYILFECLIPFIVFCYTKEAY